MCDGLPDFCFSGLKTAITKLVRETGLQPVNGNEEPSVAVKDLAASFQSVVVRSLVSTLARVADESPAKPWIVSGGVACNQALREAAETAATQAGVPVYF